LPNDGPYIFINGDIAECYTINIDSKSRSFEIREDKIPLSQINNCSFTCHIDHSNSTSDINNFQFTIYPARLSTNTFGEYEQPEKILAIADVEGNFYALQSILLSQKVIDKNGNWTFGCNHLVILGDLIDRGTNVFACLWLIYKLDNQAAQCDGKVHYLFGNHELMNFNGDFRYVHPKYTGVEAIKTKYLKTFNGASFLGDWIRSKNTVEKIGDYLFMHGGMSKQLLQQKLSIKEINNMVLNIVGKKNTKDFYNVEKLLQGVYGPLWYRGMVNAGTQEDKLTESDVLIMARFYNVKRVVIGHTVVPEFKRFFNRVVLAIDIIQPYKKNGDPVKALLIEDSKEYIVDNTGSKQEFI